MCFFNPPKRKFFPLKIYFIVRYSGVLDAIFIENKLNGNKWK
jgi:hypothetical protein